MDNKAATLTLWLLTRKRLREKQLMHDGDSLSLRIPGSAQMWFGRGSDETPQWLSLIASPGSDEHQHASLYQTRTDVCAIVAGGGRFGRLSGQLPVCKYPAFDEQARHLGQSGSRYGNVQWRNASLMILGMTSQRLLLNAELYEKCATALVSASATGLKVKALPALVRWEAGRRLRRDQRRAARAVRHGQLPAESRGY